MKNKSFFKPISRFKRLWALAALLFALPAVAQAQLYTQTFGASSGTISCAAEMFITGGQLTADNTDACGSSEATWTSTSFALSGATSINIAFSLTSDSDMESADYARVGYKIDGGATVYIANSATDFNANGQLAVDGSEVPDGGTLAFNYDLTGISGTNIQLVIGFVCQDANEDWYADNITVTNVSSLLYCDAFSASVGTFAACTATGGYFRIASGHLEASNPTLCTWTSPSVALSSYTKVTIASSIKATGDFESTSDYLEIGYKIDGGATTFLTATQMAGGVAGKLESNGVDMADNATLAFSHTITGLSGTNIQIVYRFQSNTTTEIWRVDNLCLTGSNIENCGNGVDDDGDGVIDFIDSDCFNMDSGTDGVDDVADNDLDGIPDYEEGRCVPEALAESSVVQSGNASRVVSSSNVTNPGYMIDGISNTATFTSSGTAIIDLGKVIYTFFVPQSTYIISTTSTGSFQIKVEESIDGLTWSAAGYVPDISGGAGAENWPFVPLINTRYIRISENGANSSMYITNVSYSQTIPACTTTNTNGGINPDYSDTDSDGDGCPDASEIGLGYSGLGPRDFNNDGTEDYRDATYNNCGPDTDGDGVSNMDDKDDDNDGIADSYEGGCVEAVTFPSASVSANSVSMITPQYILQNDNLYTYTDNVGDNIVVDLGRALDIGTTYKVYWRTRSAGSNAILTLSECATSGGTFVANDFNTGVAGTQYDQTTSTTKRTTTLTVQTANTRYIKIQRAAGSYEVDLDAVVGSAAAAGVIVCNPTNTDGDGLVDASDPDADNDGILDYAEAQLGRKAQAIAPIAFRLDGGGQESKANPVHDTNKAMGINAFVDADGDGISDQFDASQGGTAIVPVDTDGDGTYDFQDTDADNDKATVAGIMYSWDFMEGFDNDGSGGAGSELKALAAAVNPALYGTTDANANNVPDWLDDDDADGIPNFADPGNVTYYRDSDSDGLADLFDTSAGGSDSSTPGGTTPFGNGGGTAPYYRDNATFTILPIQLISFGAAIHDDHVVLHWETAQEINSSGFEVQRSADGEKFEKIGWVAGAGNSNSVRTYDFEDAKPLPGVSYYRLKAMDRDGAFAYSPIASVNMIGVKMQNEEVLMTYPNPCDGIFTVNAGTKNILSVTVYDSAGRAVWQKAKQVNVDISTHPSGVYTVVALTDKGPMQCRIVKHD